MESYEMMDLDHNKLSGMGIDLHSVENNSVYEESPMAIVMVREEINFSFRVHEALFATPRVKEFIMRYSSSSSYYTSSRGSMAINVIMSKRRFFDFIEFLDTENIDYEDRIWTEEYTEGQEYKTKPM